MVFDQSKIQFVTKIAPGIRALFSNTRESNRVGREPSNDIERFIKKNILIHTDEDTYHFSVGKFGLCLKMLGEDDIHTLLTFFDSINITIQDVFREADINALYLTEDELRIKTLIDNGDIETFRDFMYY
jgi:hypothetical protein